MDKFNKSGTNNNFVVVRKLDNNNTALESINRNQLNTTVNNPTNIIPKTNTNISRINNLSELNRRILRQKENNTKIIDEKINVKLEPKKICIDQNSQVENKNSFFYTFKRDNSIRILTYFILIYAFLAILLFPSCSDKGNAVFFASIWLAIELLRVSILQLRNQNSNIVALSASVIIEIGLLIYTVFLIRRTYKYYKKWSKENESNNLIDYIKHTFNN